MLRELSAREIAEWQAYYMLEPWGDEWLRSAQMATMFANANRDVEEKEDPFEVGDFMPGSWSGDEVEEWADEEDCEEAVEQIEKPWAAWKRIFEMMAKAGKEGGQNDNSGNSGN